MLACGAGCVIGRSSRREAGRDTFDAGIEIGVEEQRHRITILPRAVVDHAVHVRVVEIVSPALDHIAEVDDKGPPDGLGEDPVPGRVLDFESARVVLRQDRNCAVIGMCARAELVEGGDIRLRRIAQQAQSGARLARRAVEIALVEFERQRDEPHQMPAQIKEGQVIALDPLTETGQVLGPAIAAVVRQLGLDVGVLGAEIAGEVRTIP